MCGRYALNATPGRIIEAFQLVRGVEFSPRYNIAPTSEVPVVRQSPKGDRVADLLRWGLLPHWAKDVTLGNKLSNARAESLTEKPSFRDAFKRRRCLVPASGFFEWKATDHGKQPYFIHYLDGSVMAMAGLWESWQGPDGQIVRTFCVITTQPNSLMEPIHDRMPVFVRPEHFARWLDPSILGTELSDLLGPLSSDGMEAWPVSRAVSNARNEGEVLLEKVAPDMTS